MLKLFTRKKTNPGRELAHLNLRVRKSSSKVKAFKIRPRSLRPAGPYRPARLPRLTKNRGLGGFLVVMFVVLVIFSLAYTWKAAQMADVLSRLDAARNRRQELGEKLKSQQLILQEASNYSRIEPLARKKLGMLPPTNIPVVIAVLDERVVALTPQNNKEYLASKKDRER